MKLQEVKMPKTEQERFDALRADFERVYAPDEISKRALRLNANGGYELMQTHQAWQWWLRCADYYRVMED
jgi:hypothetical protein